MRRMLRMLILSVICTLMLSASALADDVCIVKDAASAGHVTTDKAYLRVECPLAQSCPVVLSLRDAWGSLVYQRDYGLCSGQFRSRDIPLPLEDESCDYTVHLLAGDAEHTFTLTREKPLLSDSAVYARGLSLKELNGGSSRKYAVVLDMDALNQETLVMPMVSGGAQVGEVYFSILDGKLTVSAALTAQGRIDKASVHVAADALSAMTLGSSQFSGTRTRLDRQISVNAPYAAVMVQFSIAYDPATAQDIGAGSLSREEMQESWQLMQLTTANEAVG